MQREWEAMSQKSKSYNVLFPINPLTTFVSRILLGHGYSNCFINYLWLLQEQAD